MVVSSSPLVTRKSSISFQKSSGSACSSWLRSPCRCRRRPSAEATHAKATQSPPSFYCIAVSQKNNSCRKIFGEGSKVTHRSSKNICSWSFDWFPMFTSWPKVNAKLKFKNCWKISVWEPPPCVWVCVVSVLLNKNSCQNRDLPLKTLFSAYQKLFDLGGQNSIFAHQQHPEVSLTAFNPTFNVK